MKALSLHGITLLATVAALANPTVSRAQAFGPETNTVSVGYGFVTFLGNLNETFDEYTDVNYSGMGPIYSKFEHAISEKVGLGLNVAYAGNEWSYRFND